ncbi:MAG TPA: hypothetical protein VGB13_13445 [Candidatus Krumholzibacteria bacterium]
MTPDELHQEIAMRIFLRDSFDARYLTNTEQLECERLWDSSNEETARAYHASIAARNARRDADLFVRAYYSDA